MSRNFYRLVFKRTERVKDPKGLGGGGWLGCASEAGGGVEAPGRIPPPVARPPALPVPKQDRPSAQGPQRRHCGPRRSGATGKLVSGAGGVLQTWAVKWYVLVIRGQPVTWPPQRRGAAGRGCLHRGPSPTQVCIPAQEHLLWYRRARSHRCACPHRRDCVSVSALRSGRVGAVSALTVLHNVCSRQSTATAT